MMKRWLTSAFVVILCLLISVSAFTAAAQEKELHPGLITISGGQSIGDGSYINHLDGGYPFTATVELDDKTIPMESCVLGIYSWDCDEDATGYWHNSEYDMVYVNNTFVGVLTGVDSTWKTTYLRVPIEALHIGSNTIRIYVGHRDHATGEIVQNTDDWLLEVKWLSLQIDDGSAPEAPERFEISLTSANRTESGISCSANVVIESEKQRSYVVEYSLVDRTGAGATNDQIIAGDEEYVSGTSVTSTGHFFLASSAPMGSYEIQATLRDPSTNEILAYTTKTFDLETALNGTCDHVGAGQKTFVKTELQRLAVGDAKYDSVHNAIDAYTNVCTKCGTSYYIYENLRQQAHTLPSCACGYVDPNHNTVHSASFSAVENGCAGEPFTITVVTDNTVASLDAVNTNGTHISGEWQRQDNGDGTVTWIKIYTANLVTEEQYWDITAYSGTGAKSGSMRTNSLAVKEEGTVSPGDVLDDIANKGEYTLKVLDGDTGKPVSGATVVLMGQSGTTDANGTVRFERAAMKNSKGLLIQAKEYHDHSDGQYKLGLGQSIDVITIYKAGEIKVVPMMCNDDNIATGTAQLNTKADLKAKIAVSGKVASNDKIEEYKLLQNDEELAVCTNGVFEVHNSKFIKGASLKVVMKVKTGNGNTTTAETPLNIVVVSEGLGNWFNLNQFDILNGMDLGFKGIPDMLGNFSLNFEHKKASSKQGSLESSYGLEDLVIDNYTITGGIGADVDKDFVKLNSALRKQNRLNGWSKDKSASFKASFAMQCAFNDKGIYKTTATIGANGSASFGKSHTIIGPFSIPFTVKWNVGGGVGVFVSDIGYNWNTQKWVTPDAELKLTGEVGGSVGPGCKFANAGIYGKLTLNADGSISISVPVTAKATGQLSGEVGLKAELNLGLVKWDGKWAFWKPKSEPFTIGKEAQTFYVAMIDEEQNELWEKIHNGRHLASNGVTSDVGYTNNSVDAVLAANVDALTSVQIEAIGNQLVAVYAVNDSTVEASYGHLVYQVWNGASWSDAQPVSGAGLPEGDFSLVSDGSNLYIAYVQMKRGVEESILAITTDNTLADLEALAASALAPCEIAVAVYDPSQQKFAPLGMLTDDEAYDFMPKVCIRNGRPCVAWVKDPSNSAFNNTNHNELYLAEMNADGVWQQQLLAQQLPLVAEMGLGELSGELTLAVVTDEDNDASTLSDRKLTCYVNGSMQELVQGEVDTPVFAQVRGAAGLMWYQDGNIMFSTGSEPQLLLDESYAVPAQFSTAGNEERSYLFFSYYDQTAEQGGRDLAAIDLNDESAGPVVMLDVADYVDGYDAVVQEEGVAFAFVNTKATFTEEDFITTSDICFAHYSYQRSATLYALDWSTLEFLPGEEAVFEAYVYNTGSEAIKEIAVQVTGAIKMEATLTTDIAPGAVEVVVFNCQMPAVITGVAEVRVALPGQDMASAVAAHVALDFVDFAVEARQLIVANQNYLLYTVQNIGSLSGACTMIVRRNDAEGEVLLTKEISLAAYTVENDMLPVNDFIDFTEDNISQVFYVELVISQEDAELLNNSVFVTFYATPGL